MAEIDWRKLGYLAQKFMEKVMRDPDPMCRRKGEKLKDKAALKLTQGV